MPGAILTNLQRHIGGEDSTTPSERARKTAEQGAATSVLLADLAAAGRHRRPLLRGLQRGRRRSPGAPGT